MIITPIYFVSEAYLRTLPILTQNLDIKDVWPNVWPAQDLHVEPLLGGYFYEQLLMSYSAMTLTPDEEVLVNHIKPGLAYRAAEMSLPFIQYQVKNKGPQTQFGENSSNTDIPVLSYLRKELRNRAEAYEQRLKTYLCANQSLYSGLTNSNLGDVKLDMNEGGFDSDFSTYPGCGLSRRCGGFNGFFNTNW